MKHRYYPILLLYFFQAACMPEEDLPIRHTGEPPEYFIECYCQPGQPFALSATSVLPVSEDLQIDFSKEMKVTIHADKAISLITWTCRSSRKRLRGWKRCSSRQRQ